MINIDYKLDGAGWATATMTTADTTHILIVSYLHDSLKQLAESVLVLLAGGSSTKVVFMDEPGEHQLAIA